MNEQEYKKWVEDARRALSGRYSEAEIDIIMAWFRRIKGADERDLVGHDAVEAMLVFTGVGDTYDMYNSLMARVFVYAPFILAQEAQEAQRRG